MIGFRRIWKILKITKIDKIFLGFVFFVMMVSVVFWYVEPSIKDYGDALWYSFNVITTIGFGDYHAVTLVGRIGTIIIGIYGLLITALIPGVLVSYYMDFVQTKVHHTIGEFLEKLENLDQLSKEELKQISDEVKSRRYRD